MRRPIAASLIAWILGAAVSIGVGLLALSLIGVGLTNDSGEHLTQTVDRSEAPQPTEASPPAETPASPAAPEVSPSGSAPPTTVTGANHTINTAGGNVVARCGSDGAYLVTWTPSPGFRAENVNRGPAPEARVSFEGSTREINIRVTCIGTTVHPSIEDEAGGH